MTVSESQPRTRPPRLEAARLRHLKWKREHRADYLAAQRRHDEKRRGPRKFYRVPIAEMKRLLAIEAEAAQDSRPLDVPALIDRLYVEIEELNRAFPDLDENPLVEGRIRGVKYSIGRIKEAARLAAEEPHD